MYFAKNAGAQEAISDFLYPKYPGLPGYPGHDLEERKLPETGLKPTKYDRYFIQRLDNVLTHFYTQPSSDTLWLLSKAPVME